MGRTGIRGRHFKQILVTEENVKGYKLGPMSEEHKRKIGLANKGRPRTEEWRRKTSITSKGRKMPPLTDAHKMALALGASRWDRNGPKNPNWKGGVTPRVRIVRASREFETLFISILAHQTMPGQANTCN